MPAAGGSCPPLPRTLRSKDDRETARCAPLPAGTVKFKFPVPYAAEEGMPFVGGKAEDRTCGVPAIADADLAAGQVRYFDAVTVGEAQGTLNPAGTWTIGSGRVSGLRAAHHVITSRFGVPDLECDRDGWFGQARGIPAIRRGPGGQPEAPRSIAVAPASGSHGDSPGLRGRVTVTVRRLVTGCRRRQAGHADRARPGSRRRSPPAARPGPVR